MPVALKKTSKHGTLQIPMFPRKNKGVKLQKIRDPFLEKKVDPSKPSKVFFSIKSQVFPSNFMAGRTRGPMVQVPP